MLTIFLSILIELSLIFYAALIIILIFNMFKSNSVFYFNKETLSIING